MDKECYFCGDLKNKSSFTKYLMNKDIYDEDVCNDCVDMSSFDTDLKELDWVWSRREDWLAMRKREYQKKYYSKNKDKYVAWNNARRARKASASYEIYKEDVERIYRDAEEMRSCGEDVHVDHIVPLKGNFVSGLHVPWNLAIIPAKENMKKSNKYNSEYYHYLKCGKLEESFEMSMQDQEYNRTLIKFIKDYNQQFLEEYERDMLVILHKLIGDSLCVEDITELAQRRGINNLLDSYYRCVDILDEDNEEGDY